jgi:hypothetical protein
MPILIRFTDILRMRITALAKAFHSAIREYEYKGQYRGVYPVKVNQQRHIVEDLVRFSEPFHMGLEAGSKPELLIVLALSNDPQALIVCNGYKDEEFIETALMARKLAGLPAWLASFKAGSLLQVNWRQGQNLLMALAVVALLVLVLPVTLSGYLNYKDFGGDLMEELHGAAGELFLWVVLAHLALIAGLSALRNKNQARPMLTGHTEGAGPDLVKHNARWLALLLLLSVLAYWVWAWQQSAQMLAS